MFLLWSASSPLMLRAHRWREGFFYFWRMKVKLIGVHITYNEWIENHKVGRCSCLDMDVNRSVTTNVSRLTLEHLLKQEEPRLFFWIFFFIQLAIQLLKKLRQAYYSSSSFFKYQRTYLGYRPVNLEGL